MQSSGYFFDGSKSAGLISTPSIAAPSLLFHEITSRVPTISSAACAVMLVRACGAKPSMSETKSSGTVAGEPAVNATRRPSRSRLNAAAHQRVRRRHARDRAGRRIDAEQVAGGLLQRREIQPVRHSTRPPRESRRTRRSASAACRRRRAPPPAARSSRTTAPCPSRSRRRSAGRPATTPGFVSAPGCDTIFFTSSPSSRSM